MTHYDSAAGEYELEFPNVPAKEMTEHVVLQVFDEDDHPIWMEHFRTHANLGPSYSYCVADWANSAIASNRTPEAVALAKAILNYGQMAQNYFNFNLANPANPENYLAAEMTALIPDEAYNAVLPLTASMALGYNGCSLVLEGATAIQVYFTKPITVQEDYEIFPDGNEWYILIPGITSRKLGTMYTLTVSYGGTTVEIRYGALSYANKVLYGTDPAKEPLRQLCRALYLYHRAAVAYFANR